MSYEVEAISHDQVVPAQPMREERVFSPYTARKNPQSGQSNISKGPEVPSAETPPATEETVRLAPQVAILARKEQRVRQAQQELEKAKAEIAAKEAEIAQFKAMKDKLAADDYSALEGLIDYNKYSQYQLDKLNGTNPLNEELKRIDSRVSELDKRNQEMVEKQFEAAVSERRIAAKNLVDTGNFPRIKKAQAHEAIVQHILDTFESDKEELSVEQAAKEVEAVLLEQAKKWAELLEEQQKENEPAPTEPKKTLPPLKPALKTLTNQVTSGDLTRPRKSYQQMSDSERWAEARRRAEEKLQQGRGY